MLSSHQHAAARELHNVIIDPDLKRVEYMQKLLQCSVQNCTYNGAEFVTAGTYSICILPTVSADSYLLRYCR